MKKIGLLLAAAVFCCVSEVKAAKNENVLDGKYYACGRCFKIEVSKKVPEGGKCARKGRHNWKQLASVGHNYYNCKKCFMVLPTKGKPQAAVCPASGGHIWESIGKAGVLKMTCSKCNLTLAFAKEQQNAGICKKGGVHNWKPAK